MDTKDIPIEYDKKVQNTTTQKIKGTNSSYRIMTEYGVVTGGYASDHWAHKDKAMYYQLKEVQNSLFPSKAILAAQVCWFVPKATTQGLISGYYHVYVRHGAYGEIYLPEDTDVVFSVKDGEFKQAGNARPFNSESQEILSKNNGYFVSQYIGTLDLSDFKSDQLIDVMISITQTDGDWKGNWLFEGFVFVPAQSMDDVPQFIHLGKDRYFTKIPDNKVKPQLIVGKIPPLPGQIDRGEPDEEFSKDRITNQRELLDEPFNESHLVRPIDLFSLDSTFYLGLENCKFICTPITRRGGQTGTYNVLAIIEDDNDDTIRSHSQKNLGVADLAQGDDFLSSGYENGYWNWVQIMDDEGRVVRMVILDTALGKISNERKCQVSMAKLLWYGDVPSDNILSWRWYNAPDGRSVAAVTVE